MQGGVFIYSSADKGEFFLKILLCPEGPEQLVINDRDGVFAVALRSGVVDRAVGCEKVNRFADGDDRENKKRTFGECDEQGRVFAFIQT